MMRGWFVTGTDTGVGKTVASAWLVHHLDGDYWKPVQSGLEGETDVAAVLRLSGASPGRMHPSAHVFKAPLSPHAAAALEGVTIDLADFRLPATGRPLVVEGAGGVLVPLNGEALMVDLMVRLALPVVVVSRTALGTINHTLLTLEALRHRGLEVAGVVLAGPPNPGNREAIREYGRVAILGEIPPLEPLTRGAIAALPKPLAPLEV